MQGFSREPGTEGPMSEVPRASLRRIWRWAVLVAVGGFLFGYDTGVISGALLYITPDFRLTAAQQGSVVSVLLLGAMAGALLAGRVADRIGRRATFGLEGAVFIVGTAIAVFAADFPMLLVARLVLGLAVGSASSTVPVYLSELSPTEIRGRVLTLNQLLITIGILVAYFVNLAFSSGGLWRGMFAVGAVPALLMVLAAAFLLPESPEWQGTHGQLDKARALVVSLTNEATADKLIDERRRRRQQWEADRPAQRGWRLLRSARVRPALVVGLTLAAAQQFGGINTIIYYAPTIMKETGLTAGNSILYSVAIGLINLVMTLVAIKLIDRVGRRVLLLFSLTGMTVTMALLGLAFVAGLNSILTLVFMVGYIALFAGGMGPVFWVLIGEIFPPSARAVGSSASTTVNWGSNFVVSLLFLPVANALGQGQTFWIFAAICAVALWFVGRYVPETRDRDAGQIDEALQRRFGRRTRRAAGEQPA
ncbi:putative metabolite transport protein CsbC [Actinocatenispora thailandica]|uniref:Putative metabolite transport protein CsbC n=2 Tax=Actinocatenispora thailandica TaxID=227318 RepID=A0A7R7HYI4_9ACTN|nr:putative metabolite transport protein CsbC [Actinocatenispora thailandica]